jgi:putative ABC transport system permease protein
MSQLLRRQRERFYAAHPVQTFLMVLSMSLAIALVVAIELVNHSALQAMRYAQSSTLGSATHQIQARQGKLDQSQFVSLVTEHGLTAAPVLTGILTTPSGHRYTLVGRDPIAENQWQSQINGDALDGETLASMLAGEPLLLANTETMRKENGALELAGQALRLTAAAGNRLSDAQLFGDIGLVQRLLDQPGQLSMIELQLEPEQARELAKQLPAELQLSATAAVDPSADGLIDAFQLNLRALALLSVMVASLLLANGLRFMLLQRSRALATLRAIGQPAAAQWQSLILEAIAIGVLAALLGLLIGYAMASQLLGLVVSTLNDVYLQSLGEQLKPSPPMIAIALLLAVAASSLGMLLPLWEQRRSSLQRALVEQASERHSLAQLNYLGLLGAGSLAAGLLLLRLELVLAWQFCALFMLALGGSLLALWVFSASSRWLAKHGPPAARLASRLLHGAAPRLASGIVGLCLAIACVVGIDSMISSFRTSTEDWLSQTLYAPFYISSEAALSQPELNELRQLAGVASLYPAGEARLLLAGGETLPASVVDASERRLAAFQNADADQAGIDLVAWQAEQSVMLSESLGRRLALPVGAQLKLDNGHQLNVVAWVKDYRSPLGRAFIHWDSAEQLALNSRTTSAGIDPQTGAEQTLRQALQRWTEQRVGREWFSREDIQQQSMQVFNQTFRITHVLHSLAAIVAALTLFGALLNWQLSRRADFALLRAIGLSNSALFKQMLLQSLLIGTLTALCALPLGVLLAAALILVVNVQSFGWTMQLTVLPIDLLYGLALATLAALLAGAAALPLARRGSLAR